MMRFVFMLLLVLAAAAALIAFPDIADQWIRIEAFGWLFEARQGALFIALLLLLFLLLLLRAVIRAIFSGPGTIWQSLRMGGRKRREKRLRASIARWLDSEGDIEAKLLKHAKGILPDWGMAMLQVFATGARDQKVLNEYDDPLVAVLAARMATDPAADPRPELAVRKAHIDTWLKLHPGAPLAISRKADIAEEEGDWPALVELLEEEWKRGGSSASSLKSRLARAYIRLSEHEPEQAMDHLKRAYRLLPNDDGVLLTYGLGLLVSGEGKTAVRLWSSYLEESESFDIAAVLLDAHRADPMRAYRKLESKREHELNSSMRWLRAELAYAAQLDGPAFEQMQALAESTGDVEAWQSLGGWYSAKGDYEQAATAFQRALSGEEK